MTLNFSGLSRRALKPYVAEFLGTALLIVIGDGVVAQCLLSDYQYGTWLSINFAWAAAVCLAGYFANPGPDINPAVSICIALVRPSPGQWRKLPGKLFAQFLGGFVGAVIVYINYRSAIKDWDPEYTIPGGSILSPKGHHSAGIFSTYPASFFESNWEAAFSELLGSAVLMFGALCISDPANASRVQPPQLFMFLLLLAIGASLGWQTGYVRDLSEFNKSSFVF
jgi:glycerol uptake facilitator-like aquaporin